MPAENAKGRFGLHEQYTSAGRCLKGFRGETMKLIITIFHTPSG
jgi:hypothetical protein